MNEDPSMSRRLEPGVPRTDAQAESEDGRSAAIEPIDPDAFLARVRRLQERTNLPPLTDELLDQARHEGRPSLMDDLTA